MRTPLPGKRGGKTREVASLGPHVRPAARRRTHDASALALDAARRARRGVTFSESTADDNTATVTEFQCQKVGEPTLVQPKYHPNPRVHSLVSLPARLTCALVISSCAANVKRPRLSRKCCYEGLIYFPIKEVSKLPIAYFRID